MAEGKWVTIGGRAVYIDQDGKRATTVTHKPRRDDVPENWWVLYRSGSNAYTHGFAERADAETWALTNKRAYGRILVLDHQPTSAELAKMRRRRGS